MMSSTKTWVMPEHLKPYRNLIVNTGGNSVEELMNDRLTTLKSNSFRAVIIAAVSSQIFLLENLFAPENNELKKPEFPEDRVILEPMGIPVKTEAVPRLDLAILEEKANMLDTINKAVAKLYDDAHEANTLHSLEFSTIGEKVADILGYLEE